MSCYFGLGVILKVGLSFSGLPLFVADGRLGSYDCFLQEQRMALTQSPIVML